MRIKNLRTLEPMNLSALFHVKHEIGDLTVPQNPKNLQKPFPPVNFDFQSIFLLISEKKLHIITSM